MLAAIKTELATKQERPTLAKAKLSYATASDSGSIDCQFNPETLTVSKSVNWRYAGKVSDEDKNESQPELNAPELIFAGGNSAQFAMDLIFDTTHEHNDDVRWYTNQLLALTLIGNGDSSDTTKMPPLVEFSWGDFTLFTAVVVAVEIKYTLFLPSGLPVRARAHVQFRQAFDDDAPEAAQNPTTRTTPRKTYRVRQGDRLDYLAHTLCGQSGRWREIAEANGLDDPLDIHPGQILIIPQS